MSLENCYNFEDFRKLAKKKLPAPIFHYIDGGSDDESTLRRNTESFSECDLVPNILASVGKPDLSTTLFGRKIDMPIFLSPAAMQRLYHPDGDKASARAAEKFGTFYSMSSMGNNSIEEISNISSGPKLFQLYVHKDRSISDDLIERSRRSGFDAMCLTVDTLDREHPFILPGVLANGQVNNKQITNNAVYFTNVLGPAELGTWDASVLRLSEVALSFNLPSKWLETSPFGSASITAQGFNLWYDAYNTPEGTNYDPNIAGLGVGNGSGFEYFNGVSAKRYGVSLKLTF